MTAGRPKGFNGNSKIITVMVSQETWDHLSWKAHNKAIRTGKFITVSHLVRDAIDQVHPITKSTKEPLK